ncbi:MAG: hypothetical protein GOMPHAMPRED_007138 [Gomphillus americanus]|uniref:Uncharacterized protein n=1 Tax=Gomphillus americanus TaxID=1940652 RepID=A0A8H3FY94_9LECA|nr:MAG: hypothetical protein GOMPHAMPRED_007138 [Gomphillus americanus]
MSRSQNSSPNMKLFKATFVTILVFGSAVLAGDISDWQQCVYECDIQEIVCRMEGESSCGFWSKLCKYGGCHAPMAIGTGLDIAGVVLN